MRTSILMLTVAGAVSSLPCIVRAADTVPKFDIVQTCKFETADDATVESLASCKNDENQARQQVIEAWNHYAKKDKTTCTRETNIAGNPSYVELQTCLEMVGGIKPPAQP